MGYYTQVELDLQIKKEKREMFQKEIEKLHQDMPGWWKHYADLKIDEEGYIVFEDYSRKWYEDDNFYDFLAPYVGKESYVIGQGEDFRDYWRIVFDGEGKYHQEIATFSDPNKWPLMEAAPELLDACEALLAYKSIHPEDFERVNAGVMDKVRRAVERANVKNEKKNFPR